MIKLEELELHDSLVLGLILNFNDKQIQLTFEQEYNKTPIIIVFEEFENLIVDSLSIYKEIEVYRADFKNNGNSFEANFQFLLGHSMSNWKLNFTFKNYVIK